MSFDWQELIGYVASALVVTSLAMTSVVRLRFISLAGSVTFVVYGLLIDSLPIVITNASIACINVWFLTRELGGRRDLGAVVVPNDSPFLADFLANHATEIATFQPEYDPRDTFDFALVLTRDGLPAGALLGRREGSTLHVTLDYVLRAYCDSRLGRWLYGAGANVFSAAGFEEIRAVASSSQHRTYLQQVGFGQDGDAYVLEL